MVDHVVPTPDGRELVVLEVGDPDGHPVLHHHGTPSCRLEVAHHSDELAALGLRVIAVDRPGFGRSTPHRGAIVRDWADDAALVVDALGIDRFGVSGYSAGGPPAAAVAWAMPSRVEQLSLFAVEHPSVLGAFPADAIYMEAAARLDAQAFEDFFPSVEPDPIPDAELASAADPADAEVLLAVVMEALAQGPDIGPASYYWSAARPWGFELSGIAARTTLWHGELDAIVPPVSSERYAEHLPDARVMLVPGEGHLSLWRDAPTMLSEVFGES